MVDSSAAPTESRLKRRAVGSGAALFISVVVVMALIGFFASHSGIDKALAEKRLTEWINAASDLAEEQGYTLSLTYDAIEIEGSFFSKKAAVRNVVLSSVPKEGAAGDQARSLTTGVVYLDPDLLGGGLSVILTEPLLYAAPEGRTRMVAGEPIEMVVEDYQNESGSGIAYTLLTPPHLSIERLGRQSDAVISSTDIGFGPESKVYGMIDRAKGTYTQEAQLTAIALKRNDRMLSIQQLQSVMESANANGALLSHYEVTLTGLSSNGPLEALGLMNAKIDIEFEEPVLVNGEPLNLSLGRDRQISLETLVVESPTARFNATASLRQVPNELMPFGTATVQIDQGSQLMAVLEKTGYLKNIPPAVVTALLSRIAPDWEGGDAMLTIPLKRDPNGPFYIGQLTFEEMTAILLSQLLKQSLPDLTIPTPATEGTAPATTPEPALSSPAPAHDPEPTPASGKQAADGDAPAAKPSPTEASAAEGNIKDPEIPAAVKPDASKAP
jgi:hypothetical protein